MRTHRFDLPARTLPKFWNSGLPWLATGFMGLAWVTAAFADPVPETISGVPQQIVPQAPEVGLPNYTPPAGTVSIMGGAATSDTGATGTSSDIDTLDTMLDTSWGTAAEQDAQDLGVNATAVAATCVIESGCQNVGGTGSITGAFQMTAATYTSMINAALDDDPSLASTIVPGLAGQNDPATEAVAASEYLKQAALSLEAAGDGDPTVLDVRGYYNFGPSGAALASADSNATMASVLTNASAATLVANGIAEGETVGEWRASVESKIGSAASAPVLS